jgi:hypothetical protein
MATQNPFAAYNEFTPQVQGLERQRKMAELLMQQGMQAPQGQMVSGRYVAPSWTQQLAQLGNAALGAYGMSEAEKEQKQLASKYEEASNQELANFLRARQGTPAQEAVMGSSPAITGDNAGDVEAQAGGFYGNAPAQPLQGARAAIPAQPGMDRLALAMLAGKAKYNPMLPALGAELMKQEFKEPKWEKSVITDPKTGNEIVGYIDVHSQNPESTFRPLGMGKPAMSPADIQKGIYEGWYTGQAPNLGGQVLGGQTGGQGLGGQTVGGNARDIIGAGEGGRAGYNAIYGFGGEGGDKSLTQKYNKPLSELTIGQVLSESNARQKDNRGAVGRYQFLPSTLSGLLPKAGLSVNDTFSPENQDKLYSTLRQSNSQALQASGVTPNDVTLHLAHSVGAGNVPLLLKPENQNKIAADVLGLTGANRTTNPHLNVPVNQFIQRISSKYENVGGQTTGGQTPPSYQVASAGSTPLPPGMSPKDFSEANKQTYVDKEKRRQEFQEKLPGAMSTMTDTINVVNQMIGDTKVVNGKIVKGKTPAHEGFEDVVGAWVPWSKVPGSKAADFQAMLDQVKGQAFLTAFENLKGGGAISEIEGSKATQALARMRESQSPAAFIQAAREFETNLNKGMALAQQKASGKPVTTGTTGGWSVINVTPKGQ